MEQKILLILTQNYLLYYVERASFRWTYIELLVMHAPVELSIMRHFSFSFFLFLSW